MSIFYQNHADKLRLYTSQNNTFAPHLHRQIELLTVLDGEITLTIDYCPHVLTKGMYAIVFPNQLHSLETTGGSKILLSIFDADFCHSYRKLFQKSAPSTNIISLEELSPHSEIATQGLLQLTETFPRGQAIPLTTLALAEGYLTLLLADIFSKIKTSPRAVSEDLVLEQKLLIYLESHFTENLSLEILSKEFGVSRFTLSRLFTDKLHTTFPYYVNSKRLDYACSLLLSTDLSVTQIALDAGFGSSRTFFREFSQTYHTTPREYRKHHKSLYPQ